MKPVDIKRVITVDEVDRHGLGVWCKTIEVVSGDTEIKIRCTDDQLMGLRDRLMDKFPVETEESQND